MPDWIHNSRAPYVLAAYAITIIALMMLVIISWCQSRKRAKEFYAIISRSDNVP